MLSYTHAQTVASAIWTINHNLDVSSLMLDVNSDVAGVKTPILPSKITKTTSNQIVIVFTVAQTGIARILGSTGKFIDYTNYVAPIERAIDYTHSPLV